MTRTLYNAIRVYEVHSTTLNRERVVDLIVEGHLEPQEESRLEWALKRRRESLEEAGA